MNTFVDSEGKPTSMQIDDDGHATFEMAIDGDIKSIPINASISGTWTLISGVQNQSIKVTRFLISVLGISTVRFVDGAGATLLGPVNLPANGNIVMEGSAIEPLFKCAVSQPLRMIATGSGPKGLLQYMVEE